MKAFPQIVLAHLDEEEANHAKAKEVFDIITITRAERNNQADNGINVLGGLCAVLTHGKTWHFRAALKGARGLTYHDALVNLLEATQVALAEVEKGENSVMYQPRLIQETGAFVDQQLL